MTTQSLRGMVNNGPMHWRGDRTGATFSGDPNALNSTLAFEAFNVAFNGLLGRTGPLNAQDMAAFTDFILQETYPPNPIRNLDNSLTGTNPDQNAGSTFYFNTTVDTLECNGCHVVNPAQNNFGTDGQSSFEAEPQELKIPHLRNAYAKVGMFGMPQVQAGFPGTGNMGAQVRGFGFLHDGSVDNVFDFLHAAVFTGFTSDTQRRQVEAFVLAMDSDLAPIVGQQVTLTSTNNAVPAVTGRLDLLDQRMDHGECEVIVKGEASGVQRGWVRQAGGLFRSDRGSEPLLSDAQLRALTSTVGQDLTFTAVPVGSGERMGIDRDEDGYFDRDELDAGSNPADPFSIPGATPSATPTLTPNVTATATSATPSSTASVTATPTATATATSTRTATATRPTATASATRSATATTTSSATGTVTTTPTATIPTATRTLTITVTATRTPTKTATATPANSATATITATASLTATMTASATATGTAPPTAIPTTLVPARKIEIENALPDDESRNKIIALTKSSAITIPAPGGADDPRCNAAPAGTVKATLIVSSSASGQLHSTNLPCQNWKLIGSASNPKGYKYSDPELDDGTVRTLVWKNHDLLKATLLGRGPTVLNYDLQTGVSQDPVVVELKASGVKICMQCDGSNGKDGSDGKLFHGQDCPAPAACLP